MMGARSLTLGSPDTRIRIHQQANHLSFCSNFGGRFNRHQPRAQGQALSSNIVLNKQPEYTLEVGVLGTHMTLARGERVGLDPAKILQTLKNIE